MGACRWIVESAFSSMKSMFGDYSVSKKMDNIEPISRLFKTLSPKVLLWSLGTFW